jgi:hypothetical protein
MKDKQNSNGASSQLTGNIGLYYACYRLSLLGWNAMPTSRNARGIDILAYNADCSRTISIQVKSLSGRDPVPLGKSLDRMMGEFWIIVTKVKIEPVTFIMKPDEIHKLAHRGENDEGKVSYWLQPRAYDSDNFREKWERIGMA